MNRGYWLGFFLVVVGVGSFVIFQLLQFFPQFLQYTWVWSAAIGALVGVGVQFLSHHQTVSREQDRYNIEVYQRFFAPVLTDIFSYLRMRTHFLRGHDVLPHKELLTYQRIFDHFSRNIHDASSRFIFQYQQLQDLYMHDETDFMSEIEELELIRVFLDELYHVIAIYPSFDNRGKNGQLRSVAYYRLMYRLFVVASRNYESVDGGAHLTSLSWMFGKRMNISWFQLVAYQLLKLFDLYRHHRTRLWLNFEQFVFFVFVSRDCRGTFRDFIESRFGRDQDEDGKCVYDRRDTELDPSVRGNYANMVMQELLKGSFFLTEYSEPSLDCVILGKIVVKLDEDGVFYVNGSRVVMFSILKPFSVFSTLNGKRHHVLSSQVPELIGDIWIMYSSSRRTYGI